MEKLIKILNIHCSKNANDRCMKFFYYVILYYYYLYKKFQKFLSRGSWEIIFVKTSASNFDLR